jgi:PilZ domain
MESCIPPDMTLDSRIMVKHRKAPRYQLGLKGSFHRTGDTVGAHVTVLDISTQGCELEHAQGSRDGEICELYFDWEGAHIGVEAQVVWKNAKGHAGLKFLRIDKVSHRRLNGLCAALSTRPQLPRREAHATHHQADPTHSPRVAHPTTSLAAPVPQPGHRKSDERRRVFPRYVSELRGYLSNLATSATTSVIVDSLSISGASLHGSHLPDPGQACELQTEWDGNPFVLRCNVVWKTEARAGVRFSSVDEEAAKLLRRTCANLRLQPPGLPPR